MAIFPLSGVLREFTAAAYRKYASPKILVRPCSTKKWLIYESDTDCVKNEFVEGHDLRSFRENDDMCCIGLYIQICPPYNEYGIYLFTGQKQEKGK